MIPLETTGERMFECACYDGNYGLEAILRGARQQEKQLTRQRVSVDARDSPTPERKRQVARHAQRERYSAAGRNRRNRTDSR